MAALFIDEPPRGMSEPRTVAALPWRSLLTIPTMWWLILSGALHNFNMYALGSFLVPLAMRYYHTGLRQAGLMNMVIYGLSGVPGLLAGGALADRWAKRRRDGRLIVATIAILISAPLLLLAVSRPSHQV